MKKWHVALGLTAFSIAIRVPLLDAPLDRDEGSLACFALGLLDGRMPYRDFADIKPPLLYPAYLPLALAGSVSSSLFRLAGAFWNSLSVLLLWRLSARIMGEKTALVAGVLMALFTADPSAAGFIISPELLSHLPVAGAMLLLYSAIRLTSPRQAVLAGAILGIAIGMKQQALPLVFMVITAWGCRQGARISLGFFSGALATGLASTGGLALAGLFWPALDCASWGAIHILKALPVSGITEAFASIFGGAAATQAPLWLLAAIGLSDSRIPRRDRIFIGTWLLGALAGIAMGRRPYPYYLQLVVPPLALAGGLGIRRLFRKPVGKVASSFRWILAGATLLSLFQVFPLLTVTREIRARSLQPDNYFLEAEAVAGWLAKNAPGNKPVFIAGSELEIAFQSGMKFAGRAPLPYLLSVKSPDSGNIAGEWIKGVRSDEPGSAVFCRSMKAWGDVYSDPETTRRLKQTALNYLSGPEWKKAVSIPPFDVYLRNR